jgi:hypothetical protein
MYPSSNGQQFQQECGTNAHGRYNETDFQSRVARKLAAREIRTLFKNWTLHQKMGDEMQQPYSQGVIDQNQSDMLQLNGNVGLHAIIVHETSESIAAKISWAYTQGLRGVYFNDLHDDWLQVPHEYWQNAVRLLCCLPSAVLPSKSRVRSSHAAPITPITPQLP